MQLLTLTSWQFSFTLTYGLPLSATFVRPGLNSCVLHSTCRWVQLPPVGDYSPLLYRLTSTPCEQDYEHFPSQWYCEGCMGESMFDKIKEYAALSEERREAYEAYLGYWDEGTLEDFEERYEGKWNSAEDFAENLCEECGYFKNLPQWLQCYIDYSAVWRHLDTAGDYTEVDGHIFRN